MTDQWCAKLCRDCQGQGEYYVNGELYECFACKPHNKRTPPATPSPEVDEIEPYITEVWKKYKPCREAQSLRAKIGGELPENLPDYVWDVLDIGIQAAMNLAPQGAMRVDLEKCGAALKPFIGNKNYNEEAAKAVILSLKQQNPGVQFDEQ